MCMRVCVCVCDGSRLQRISEFISLKANQASGAMDFCHACSHQTSHLNSRSHTQYSLNIIGGSCHRYNFSCCNKSMLAMTKLVATNTCCDKYLLLQTILLQQTFCAKMCFVMINMCLLQQTRVCCDKYFL